MANPNFDEILSTTLANYRKSMTDNVFSRRSLAFFLKDKGRVQMEDGGVKIVEPILLTTASGAGSYRGYDTLSLATSDTGTSAEFNWKQYQAPVAIDGYSELLNAGQSVIIKLLAQKVQQAEDTILENLNLMWFGDGTGNGGKDFLGLAALVGDDLSTITTVGGIDCTQAANAKWRSYVKRLTGSNNFSQAHWRKAINTTTYGADKAELGMTTQDVFERYEGELLPSVRYQDVKAANAGFTNLTFKNIPIMFDDSCQVGATYFLNMKYLRIVGHSAKWFLTTPFQTPYDKDAKWAHVLLAGEMTTNGRRYQSLVSGQTVV